MPDVDSTLRLTAQWKNIIATDLTSTFYQIPLSRGSMKYCGVATPFRGVRVYARSAMGMPGSETALEELMSRVLGDLLKEGIVAKIADDLYCGRNSPSNLNARIRSRGLSSREMWTQLDQFSNHQIPLHDQSIIVKQHEQRVTNHTHSEKAKAPISSRRPANNITVGDLVYLFSARNKTRARDRYLVVEVSGSFCNIRKFVGSQLRSTSYRVKTTDCYRVPSEVTGFQSPAANSDTDSSSDEATSVQPEPSPPAPPVIPSAISTPAIQEVPDVNLPADQDEPYEDTNPDPVLDSPTTGNDSDSSSLPRRSSCVRRRPARYDDFVMGHHWVTSTTNFHLLTLSYGFPPCRPLDQRTEVSL